MDASTRAERHALAQRARAISHALTPMPSGVEPRLAQIEGVRAVLFDVYGTLLISGSGDVGVREASDDAEVLADAMRSAGVRHAAEAGPRGVERLHERIAMFHDTLRGRGVDYPEVDIRAIWADVLGDLKREGLVEGDPDPASIERLAVEYECRVNPAWPMPGAAAVLDHLHGLGTVLGIVSNAQFFTPLMMRGLFGRSVTDLGFQAELCAWSFAKLRAKPGVALYRPVLARLRSGFGIEPHQTLYIGNDRRNDILPAATLGCRTALFAGDQRSYRPREDDPDCEGVEPDAVLTRLTDVLRVMGLEG